MGAVRLASALFTSLGLTVHSYVMMTATRTERGAKGLCGLLALGLAASFCVGCTSGRGAAPGSSAMTPRQAALGAFNVYDADLRRRSVNELAAAPFGGEPKYVETYRTLLSDPDPTVRAASINALALHGGVDDTELLVLLMDDSAALVRRAAAKGLQRIHNPSAVKPLMDAMADDPDADVRMSAADALGQYAERRVFDALVGALEDMHHSVVVAARRSLKTLTGYDFGSDGAMWITWADQVGGDLFEHRETYTWRPYRKPRGIVDKARFWNRGSEADLPRVPTGMGDGSS